MSPLEPAVGAIGPVPVIVHLSGSRRGTTQRLRGDRLRIGSGGDVEVRVSPEPCVAEHHATLERRGATYELRTQPDRKIWVNGQESSDKVLTSGDLLEVGPDGPILRFRLYPPGTRAEKTLAEAFSDSLDSARYGAGTPFGQATLLLSGALKEFATQTSLWFRLVMVFLLALLLATLFLARRSYRLERRLVEEETRVRGIAELVQRSSQRALNLEDLVEMRGELSTAVERVEALEALSDAPARVVAASSRSVVLLQGAYGFVDPESGEALRFQQLGEDGHPLRTGGEPVVGLGGEGPLVEAYFTGTAFMATGGGLLLTNRHVALPWNYDEAAQMVISQGLAPAMHKFIAYLPGRELPSDVKLILAARGADLAVLRCPGLIGRALPLTISRDSPLPGDEIIVLGYPAGIRALLARADEDFVEELMRDRSLDFWAVAQRLAEAGHVAPLASRGIVAQVSSAAVVYDAETTRGGSGGPVLSLEGEVVAVTSAIVGEFGGSNIGVPASRALPLLQRAALTEIRPPPLR